MIDTIRVFVGGKGGDVPKGASLLDAVRTVDADGARLVEGGHRIIADSRGLPVSPDALAYSGVILRLVSVRQRQAGQGT
jgi:hypothetical protein